MLAYEPNVAKPVPSKDIFSISLWNVKENDYLCSRLIIPTEKIYL